MAVTAQQRQPFNRALARCPGRDLLAVLGEKWATPILAALEPGRLRRGELARAIPGVPQKMLTRTPRRLERHGLVAREAYDSCPDA